ncbi:MAG: SPFH domain-containing protein [bacterium]|nr:SPFH domain-containing protein [bacterium]
MLQYLPGIGITVLLVAGVALAIFIATLFRVVVPTNMVHIVQSRKQTTPYGTGQGSGNVYFKWPSWVPYFGINVIKLPVSNFDLSLNGYEAYDKDRVPFMVDVVSFFRIKDTAVAARRVVSVQELEDQLSKIVQGAVRKVLASDVIDNIMLERAKFGTEFTEEVREQLMEWGVEPVKSMELMDIRDSHDSKVIANIMAKKTSHIEMESRTEVANNLKNAQTAEINAKQLVDIRQQEAEQAVGERTALKDQQVGIAKEKYLQEVATQKKETKTRDMDVKQVEQVREADITKEKQVVAAKQEAETTVIKAEGALSAKRKEAQGIEAEGLAKAEAEKAMKMAPVTAQIALAQEIGENEGYQKYLAIIEALKAHIVVGSKQAEALQDAQIKIIANTGKPIEGVSSVMDLFSTKGGTELAGMVEAFAQTPLGGAVLAQLGIKEDVPNADAGKVFKVSGGETPKAKA